MRKIITINDPDASILRERVPPITKFGAHLSALQREMDNMVRSIRPRIVGLAANQIGERIRMLVVDREWVFCNPTVVQAEGREVTAEGCASIPGAIVLVARPTLIQVKYQNTAGCADQMMIEGRDARIFLHELDHLDGTLITDKVERDWNPRSLLEYQEAREQRGRPREWRLADRAAIPPVTGFGRDDFAAANVGEIALPEPDGDFMEDEA